MRFKSIFLAFALAVLMLTCVAWANDSFEFPEGKWFVNGEMVHRYTVIGTTSGPGKVAIKGIINDKNAQLEDSGMPLICLFQGPTVRISIEFDHVRDIRGVDGKPLSGSNSEQLRVVPGVLVRWCETPERYAFFIFDTLLRTNNASPPNNELSRIQRQINIGKMDGDDKKKGEVEDPNYRKIVWDAESLTDIDRWFELEAEFTYDLDSHLVNAHPDPISLDTHVSEINVNGRLIDVVLPETVDLVGFDRRFFRVEVPLVDIEKLKLDVSSSDPDVQTVFDHTQWNSIREEVFTSSAFIRVPLPLLP